MVVAADMKTVEVLEVATNGAMIDLTAVATEGARDQEVHHRLLSEKAVATLAAATLTEVEAEEGTVTVVGTVAATAVVAAAAASPVAAGATTTVSLASWRSRRSS